MREVKVIVAIDLSMCADRRLVSLGTLNTIKAMTDFINERGLVENEYVIAYCNTELAGVSWRRSHTQKATLLSELLSTPVEPISISATNSITEARNIRDALSKREVEPSEIVLFCDHYHWKRLKLIWAQTFPGITIEPQDGTYVIDSDYAQLFLRNQISWRLMNFLGWAGMRIFGIEWFALVRQP
jgi:hypothetical protein